MRSGGARHIVFGRLAAVEDDQVNAVIGGHTADGTVCGDAILDT